MGISHAVAFLVLTVAMVVSGGALARQGFGQQAELNDAWRESMDRQAAMERSAMQVVAVLRGTGGDPTHVHVDNVGATTLDAALVDVLFGGVAVAVASRNVDGVASGVWPPLTTLNLTIELDRPSSILVACDLGATAVWRA